MTSERADQGATPANHHSHPGATLAAQREAMGWSVEQVAEQLKLAVRQVVAIEAGDYAALPSPAVTRGFVRAYAKIVRLDPAPLVAMVKIDEPVVADTDAAARRERPTSFSHSRFPTHGKRSSLPLGWIAAVVVVAAAAGAAWNFGLIKLPGSDATADAVPTVPADGAVGPVAPAHDPAVPLISVPAPGDANGAAPANTPANVPATAPAGNAATPPAANVPAAPAATAPAANAPAAVVTAPGAAAPVAAAGANTLVLSVREDSWIEVRPQGGRALISRLVKAGSTETVEVPGTATLVVGNPGAVTATLRGAAVALPQVPGKTISRVTIK